MSRERPIAPGDHIPLNVRIFAFLAAPGDLWVHICGFLCGVEIEQAAYWVDDDLDDGSALP